MDQKEVTSRDCYVITKEGVPSIVSNSEKKVCLLIKARAASLHSDISSDRNMKTHSPQSENLVEL